MKEKLKEIVYIQNEIEELEKVIKKEKEKFEESIESNKVKIEALKSKLLPLKETIESDVLKKYEETKEKKYEGGVGVQERKVINYDEEKVFEWALDKKMFLSLDKKSFEKVAENIGAPTVEVGTKTIVTWPKTILLED